MTGGLEKDVRCQKLLHDIRVKNPSQVNEPCDPKSLGYLLEGASHPMLSCIFQFCHLGKRGCLLAQHFSGSACVIVPFPSRLSQCIAQDRPLHIPVCGIGVQSGELPQAPLRSGYKSRAFLGMRDDLFAQQLAQQQRILPSALCSSERWKLLPHIRVMVRQPSAPLS